MTKLSTAIRRMTLSTLAILSLSFAIGCGGGGGGDVVVEACERFDECNLLEGQSVNECVESVDRNLTAGTPTEVRDWERLMDGCLTFEGCGTFVDCVVGNNL